MAAGIRSTAKKFGIHRSTVRDWVLNQAKIFAFSVSEKDKMTQGLRRPELIPFACELLTCMKNVRHENGGISIIQLECTDLSQNQMDK